VTGWKDFEPLLSRIEQIKYRDLWRFAAEVPQEWYQYDARLSSNLSELCTSAARLSVTSLPIFAG